MPTVSINLSEKAYFIYTNLEKTTRSKVVSAALLEWNARIMHNLNEFSEVKKNE